MATAVFASIAEVASSKIIHGVLRINARANVRRCFSPPDKLFPSKEIIVSNFSGKLFTKSYSLTFFKISKISSSVFFIPSRIFSLIDILKIAPS